MFEVDKREFDMAPELSAHCAKRGKMRQTGEERSIPLRDNNPQIKSSFHSTVKAPTTGNVP